MLLLKGTFLPMEVFTPGIPLTKVYRDYLYILYVFMCLIYDICIYFTGSNKIHTSRIFFNPNG